MNWLRYPIGIGVAWFAAAQGLAIATTPAAGETYLGLQGNVGTPFNTQNTDRDEASSETVPGVCLFGGNRLRSWLAVEAHGCWQYQRAHGWNPDGPDHRSTTNGTFQTFAVTAGPRFILADVLPVEPYLSIEVGPAVSFLNTTRDDETVFDAAGRLAVGVERSVMAGVSARLEASYLHVGAEWDSSLRQANVGVALVVDLDPLL